MHQYTYDFKDRHQHGDDERPHDLQLFYGFANMCSVLQYLLNELNFTNEASMLKRFELDMYEANKTVPFVNIDTTSQGVFINPLFARYYYWYNPYQPTADYKDFMGEASVGIGQGLVLYKGDKRNTMVHMQNFSNGIVDHYRAHAFGDIRIYKDGKWKLNHPIGYMSDMFLFNQVQPGMKMGPTFESSGMLEHYSIPNKLFYAGGISCGVNQWINNGNWSADPGVKTWLHENQRKTFELLDGPELVMLVIDRVHMEDPRNALLQATFNPMIDAVPNLKHWLWHTPISPTVDAKTIKWEDMRIEIISSTSQMQHKIVDETTDTTLGGYVNKTEKKFHVQLWPEVKNEFDIVVTGITDSEFVTFEPYNNGELIGAIVKRPGKTPVLLACSNKIGPKLATTFDPTKLPTKIIKLDKTKNLKVNSAIKLSVLPEIKMEAYIADIQGEVITAITQTEPLPPPPPPPPPPPSGVTIEQVRDEIAKGTVPLEVSIINCETEIASMKADIENIKEKLRSV
jgi:hypothetical protein